MFPVRSYSRLLTIFYVITAVVMVALGFWQLVVLCVTGAIISFYIYTRT